MTRLSWPRELVAVLAVSVALILQSSVFSHLAWHGVVPDLVLLVVVAAGLAHGTEYAMVLGFGAGLLLDLAPPADHYAGRWALALLVVGYVAGRLTAGQSGPTRPVQWLALAAACSFLGNSVYALTGLVLRDPGVAVPELLRVTAAALAWDVAAALVVIPVVLRAFERAQPDRVRPERGRAERVWAA
jgi:rod shape-determining protein MreD